MTSFQEARATLLTRRTDYDAAVAEFRWPDDSAFNWALDWFDGVLASDAESRTRDALTIVDAAAGTEQRYDFRTLSLRSNRVANYLRSLGVVRGDRILLLLGNVAPLWEIMLAAIKLGAVVVPATPLLTSDELLDRVDRAHVKLAITSDDQVAKFDAFPQRDLLKVLVGPARCGWQDYAAADSLLDSFEPHGETRAADPLLLYFTSGTTAKPKLVMHSQSSYPVGSLSTMYWLGLQPGDTHLNISSPGWAKHAWSSFFAPWSAGAGIFAVNQPRFSARVLLDVLAKHAVTTLCAPPTVWRMIVQEDLRGLKLSLRELCSAGEPLNPEIIDQIQNAWGLSIRDGFGQTETTAQIGNSPGQPLKPGAMGRPLPGYRLALRDADGMAADEGELHLDLADGRPAGLMAGYLTDDGRLEGIGERLYRTGDIAFRDADGFFTFVGRGDDVFKSSDYRISPFELESILIEHPLVVEAAVVPAPDDVRLSIPKAYVTLREGTEPSGDVARAIFKHLNSRLAPFKRIRRIEFLPDLPKTISGKIRRVQLRRQELEDALAKVRRGGEYREDDQDTTGAAHGPASRSGAA